MASPSIQIVEEGRPVHVITGKQKLIGGAGEEIPVRVVTANQSLVIVVQNGSQNQQDAPEADAPPPPPAQHRESSRFDRKPPEVRGSREGKKPKIIKPYFPYRYRTLASHSSGAATIERIPYNLPPIIDRLSIVYPLIVAIGPLHRDWNDPEEAPKRTADPMGAAKEAAVEEYCHVAGQLRDAVHGKMLPLVGEARQRYGDDWNSKLGRRVDDAGFADMLLMDGCFLLQFMVSLCRDDDAASPDPLMARPEVGRNVDDIARDIFLVDNQIPWFVLEALIELRQPYAAVPVGKFLALMATAFDLGNIVDDSPPPLLPHDQPGGHEQQPLPPPPHLLGLFHRRQVGATRTPSRRVLRLSALSTTAVELAEMGVKLTASKTKKFGDMIMSKRRQPLGLFGELSLAPVVLSELTQCWLLHMAAYEARQGDFAVGSYVNAVSLLVNRPEDVQELRAKGIVVSAFDNRHTLSFFKALAPQINVGDRYYEVFECLQEYRKERWLWIAIHKFWHKNFKTVVTVLSIAGVLAGLFKTILSLKQPNVQG